MPCEGIRHAGPVGLFAAGIESEDTGGSAVGEQAPRNRTTEAPAPKRVFRMLSSPRLLVTKSPRSHDEEKFSSHGLALPAARPISVHGTVLRHPDGAKPIVSPFA